MSTDWLPDVTTAGAMVSGSIACGLAAFLLTPWACRLAGRPSRWTYYRVHVAVAAAGGALAGLVAAGPGEWLAYAVLAVAAGLLVVVDLIDYRLPNIITKPLYLAVGLPLLITAAATGQWGRFGTAAAACAASVAVYYALSWIRASGLGLGDVKLAGPLGLALGWLGWPAAFYGLFLAFALFAVAVLLLLAARRIRRDSHLPFGPWMIAGAALAALVA